MVSEGCVTFTRAQGYHQSIFFSKVISFEDLCHFVKQVSVS